MEMTPDISKISAVAKEQNPKRSTITVSTTGLWDKNLHFFVMSVANSPFL